MATPPSVVEQIKVILRLLDTRKYDLATDTGQEKWKLCLAWVERFPSAVDPALKVQLTQHMCKCFGVNEIDIIRALEGGLPSMGVMLEGEDKDAMLRKILPKGGWFEYYADYTQHNESPLSYHIFSSLSILGASLGRRVYKPMGFFNIYPNYCSILIGPTGIKKTSATDIARNLIHETSLCPIMADAVTPESLATALVESGHHFIYAPEFAVFFGKQKYNEGLTTRIIRLLDCPNEFKVRTLARGEETVTDIAITMLGASTLSLLGGASASEVASSGFLNRFMLVVEKDTERCFPQPQKGASHLEEEIIQTIRRVKAFDGAMSWTKRGEEAHDAWYRGRKKYLRNEADELTVEVLQRSFQHVLRTAMLVHLAQCDNMEICDKCLAHAVAMVEYAERSIPQTVHALKATGNSQDLEFLTSRIYKAGGAVDHSTLLRSVSNKMTSTQMKAHLNTLNESGRIKISKRGAATYYILQGDISDAGN